MKDDFKLVSDINITPLTDVMLVLLIIFMISAPFIVPRGKEVHLPKVKEFKTLKSENNLLLIARDGSMQLNGISVSQDEFRMSMENIVNMSSEPVNLFIRGDESVDYGKIIKAMDIAKISGVERISLVSEVDETEPAKVEEN